MRRENFWPSIHGHFVLFFIVSLRFFKSDYSIEVILYTIRFCL